MSQLIVLQINGVTITLNVYAFKFDNKYINLIIWTTPVFPFKHCVCVTSNLI